MSFIYHGAQDSMIGNILMPLNQMHDSMSQVRASHLAKYKGREEIIERKTPLLNCLWNDVLQFLPLHPQKVFELQQQLRLIPEIPPYNFFEIDITNLDPKKTTIFFKTAPGEENTVVKWLKDVDITSLQEIPKATLEYYKTLIGTGVLPFNYQFIPHVLYKGSIDIADTKTITLINN